MPNGREYERRLPMPDWNREEIEHYLRSVLGEPVTVVKLTVLGKHSSPGDARDCGYGIPLKVDVLGGGRDCRTFVLHTMSPGPFGHEHMADRAKQLIWEHQAFDRLPKHVHSLDVGGFQTGGRARGERARADTLCDYLVEIHKSPGNDPGLYVRRIRELIGDGECIMGIADSYPANSMFL